MGQGGQHPRARVCRSRTLGNVAIGTEPKSGDVSYLVVNRRKAELTNRVFGSD